MEIVYPISPEKCPSYLQCGGNDWRDQVRIANNFGNQSSYKIGDKVETISFYFADSQSNQQNQVIIEKGVLENIIVFSTHTSYHVKCEYCTKITTPAYIRPQ